MKQYFTITDHESEHPELSNNGGDYFEGRTIVVENGRIIEGRYWSSSDFRVCLGCGKYLTDYESDCCQKFYSSDIYHHKLTGNWKKEGWKEILAENTYGIFLPVIRDVCSLDYL